MYRVLLLLLVACSGGGSTASDPTPKNLWSVWTSVTNPNESLDFSSGQFNSSFLFDFVTQNFSECQCTFIANGSQTTGTYSFSNCSYINGTGNGVDPGCAGLDTSGTFTKTATILTTCDNTGCTNFK